tara:strand:+ start:669 stop:872 length:204 start_codon:yes stop_codon:yes gene_type:complete
MVAQMMEALLLSLVYHLQVEEQELALLQELELELQEDLEELEETDQVDQEMLEDLHHQKVIQVEMVV